jgi:hypothetical protein
VLSPRVSEILTKIKPKGNINHFPLKAGFFSFRAQALPRTPIPAAFHHAFNA